MATEQTFFKKNIQGKPCYANAIKRILVRDIPTYAFTKININRNVCSENLDELKLRLSMIPVCGRAKVSVEYAIAQNSKDHTVTTDDFQYIEGDEKMVIPDFFIANLTKGQILSFDMETTIGTGKQHTKWVACGAYLSYKKTDGFTDNGVVLVIERHQIDPVKLYDNAVRMFRRRMNALLEEFNNGELVPIVRKDTLIVYELDENNYDVAYIMPIVIELRETNQKGDDSGDNGNQISAEYTKKHPSSNKYHLMIKGKQPVRRMISAIRTVINKAENVF